MFYILIMIPLSHPFSETEHLMFSSPESSGSQIKLTVYACYGVRRRRRCRRQCLNIFFETALPIKAKLYVEPPWEGGTKDCLNGPGHMTKMAAMPIYCKNLQKFLSPEPVFCDLETLHVASSLKPLG